MKRPKENNTINRHEEEHQQKVRKPMHHLKRSMLVCLLAFVLTTLLTAGVAQAAELSSGTWSIVPSANHGKGYNDNLVGVAAVSSTDIWAVGYYNTSSRPSQPLIEHWNGTSWQFVPSPRPGSDGFFYSVAAVSATDIWAVGFYDNSNGTDQTLIEHWDGTSWQTVSSPNPGSAENNLQGVTAVSASNIWAVGGYANSGGPDNTLIEHWNGSNWQVFSSPNVGDLYGVAAVSATDVWAVGTGNGTLIEHWNGASWQVIPSPNPGGASYNQLDGVAAVSSTDIWAVGYYSNSNFTYQTLIEHWNGTTWQVVASPNVGSGNNYLYSVAAVSATDVWAVGFYCCSSSRSDQTLIEHWNGTNWQVVSSPNAGSGSNLLQSVAAVSATDVWAVGAYYNATKRKFQTLIELYS